MFPILQVCAGERIDLEISLPEDLMIFTHAVNNGGLSGRSDVTVRLTADLDLTGFHWVPIGFGEAEFSGVFDGGGHAVRGLTIQKKGPGNYGLFGAVSGTVQNVAAGTIQNLAGDPHSAVGGIVEELSGGVIRNCVADFAVDGGGEPLGLFAGGVASAAENSLIQNCRASIRMESLRDGGLYLGGVAGCVRDSRAEDCAFDSPPTAKGAAGVILGESALANCVRRGTADGNCLEKKEAAT